MTAGDMSEWRQTHGLLYLGDRYAGRMSTPDLADKVVAAMNSAAELTALRAVVAAAKAAAILQPAAYANTQAESDRWARLYDALAALDKVGGAGE